MPGVRGLRKEMTVLRDLAIDVDKRHILVTVSYTHLTLPTKRIV